MDKASSMRLGGGGTGDCRHQHRTYSVGRMNRKLGTQQQPSSRMPVSNVLSSSTLGQFMPSTPAPSSVLYQGKSVKAALENHSSIVTDKPNNVKDARDGSFETSFPSWTDTVVSATDMQPSATASKADWAGKAAQPPPALVVKVDERVIERDREEQELARLRALVPKKSPIYNDKKTNSPSTLRQGPSSASINNDNRALPKPIKADSNGQRSIVSTKKVVALGPNRPKLRSSLRTVNSSSRTSSSTEAPPALAISNHVIPPSPPLSSRSAFTPTPPPLRRDCGTTVSATSTIDFSSADSDTATSAHDEIDARIQADLDEWSQNDDFERGGTGAYLSPVSSFSSTSPFDRSASSSPLALAMSSSASNRRAEEHSRILDVARTNSDPSVDRKPTNAVPAANEDDWKELNQLLLATTIGQPELDVRDQPVSPNGCISPSLLETSWGNGSGLWSDDGSSSSQSFYWEVQPHSGWASANNVPSSHGIPATAVSSAAGPLSINTSYNSYSSSFSSKRISPTPFSIPAPINTTIATPYCTASPTSAKQKTSPLSASTTSTTSLKQFSSPVDPWYSASTSLMTPEAHRNGLWIRGVF